MVPLALLEAAVPVVGAPRDPCAAARLLDVAADGTAVPPVAEVVRETAVLPLGASPHAGLRSIRPEVP